MENTSFIANEIKKRLPNVVIVLGGHLATLAAEEIIENLRAIDIILKGDAEQSLAELVGGRDLREISGACWRGEGNTIRKSSLDFRTSDLDRLATPARDDLDKLLQSGGSKSARILASRGCQYNCSFCTTPSFYGQNPRFRNPKEVVQEMSDLYNHRGITHFWFNDDLFVTGSQKNTHWIEEFCERLSESRLSITFRILCRADSFRDKNMHVVQSLKSVGLTHVFLGLEAGSDDALRVFNKHITVEQNVQAISLLKGADIQIQIGFIMFNPYSTLDEVRENAKFLADIGELFRFFPLTRSMDVFLGTPIYYRLLRDGMITGRGFDANTTKPKYLSHHIRTLAGLMNNIYDKHSKVDHILLERHRGINNSLDAKKRTASEKTFASINLKYFLAICDSIAKGGEHECQNLVDTWMMALISELSERSYV